METTTCRHNAKTDDDDAEAVMPESLFKPQCPDIGQSEGNHSPAAWTMEWPH